MPVITIFHKGEKYGHLTLTGKFEFRNGVRYAETICDCGNTFYTQLGRLRKSTIKSCGCKRSYYNSLRNTKHGFDTKGMVHPIYRAYQGMKQRCYNPNSTKYEHYGKRGIMVCDQWLFDFNKFKNWSLNNGWAKGLTLHRKNNNKNYSPNNCVWANYEVQNRNRSITVNISAFNETKCLQEWYYDKRCSVTAKTIKDRIQRGWKPELAITEPSMSIQRKTA